MSLRTFFSRLLSPTMPDNASGTQTSNNSRLDRHRSQPWRYRILRLLLLLTLILSAVWLLMAIWYQFGAVHLVTWLTTIFTVGLLGALFATIYMPNRLQKKTGLKLSSKWLLAGYSLLFCVGVGWFFSIEAKQTRDWQPEVSQVLSYTRDSANPDLITFTNVRNFDWYLAYKEADGASEVLATERWETRTVDMSKLSGIDITNSYWMGPLIAHTLVSFRFEDDRPLAFSFEIRKEADESFSALAGFFRRYELSLIAAEERDIIYTRSNARGEQVYLLPVSHLQQHEVKSLFESYLTAADELNAEPAWYNTLVSNCTNIIFYMARLVSGDRLPWDYRIWVSGWLPNYLYEIGMLDANPQSHKAQQSSQPWTMEKWYERTHINPKVIDFDNQSTANYGRTAKDKRALDKNSHQFSQQIRQDIPIPPLADSRSQAEQQARSTAIASNEDRFNMTHGEQVAIHE